MSNESLLEWWSVRGERIRGHVSMRQRVWRNLLWRHKYETIRISYIILSNRFVNLIMSFCFQLGHSSVALTPERSVASCPRRWMTGMTGYLGRWVPSVIFYVHFSFWLTAFIQNVISHHLYEIKICCLNNISFQNLL